MAKVTVSFTKEKETTGTVRYKEDGDPAQHKVGTQYLKKATVAELGNPDAIEATYVAK